MTQDSSGAQEKAEEKSKSKPGPSRSVRETVAPPAPPQQQQERSNPTGAAEGSRNASASTRSRKPSEAPQKKSDLTCSPQSSKSTQRLLQGERRRKNVEDEIKVSKVGHLYIASLVESNLFTHLRKLKLLPGPLHTLIC